MKKLGLVALLGVMLMTYVYAGPSANIRLKPNQQMVDITLAANPTTGYQWFVKNYDHDLLSLQNYRYIANNNKDGKVGKGGVAIFSFAVDPRFYDAPQVTSVSFVYQQPWNPGQNAAAAQVTVSATASSNDLSNWQKYPQLAGPAAEVQASEAQIYREAQSNNAAVVVPAPMVTLPSTGASNSGVQKVAPVSAPTPAPTTSSATASDASTLTAMAPDTGSTSSMPVVTTTSTGNQVAPTPVVVNNDQVMPEGQPTPDTDSQSQWLSLPASSNQATSNSGASSASANTQTTTSSPAANAGTVSAMTPPNASSSTSSNTTSK